MLNSKNTHRLIVWIACLSTCVLRVWYSSHPKGLWVCNTLPKMAFGYLTIRLLVDFFFWQHYTTSFRMVWKIQNFVACHVKNSASQLPIRYCSHFPIFLLFFICFPFFFLVYIIFVFILDFLYWFSSFVLFLFVFLQWVVIKRFLSLLSTDFEK